MLDEAPPMTAMLDHALLKAALHYHPETGVWSSRIRLSEYRPAGIRIDSKYATAYRAVFIFGQQYPAHLLAWFYMTGAWVVGIDHKNCIGSDNRWTNLRAADQSQNGANHRLSKNNTSGAKGVTWDKARNKWKAQIKVKRRNIVLGRFELFEEARTAREAGAEKIFGEYARHA